MARSRLASLRCSRSAQAECCSRSRLMLVRWRRCVFTCGSWASIARAEGCQLRGEGSELSASAASATRASRGPALFTSRGPAMSLVDFRDFRGE